MEIFIGNRLEEFKVFANGLFNSKGMRSPADSQDEQSESKANDSSVFKLDEKEESVFLHCVFESEEKMNEQAHLDFNHGLNEVALQEALDFLVKKYSKLRSNFVFDRFSIPVKRVFYQMSHHIDYVKCKERSTEEQEYQMQLYMKEEKSQIFELGKAPLMKISLINYRKNRFRLVWTCHSILLTDLCMSKLIAELWTMYESFSSDYLV